MFNNTQNIWIFPFLQSIINTSFEGSTGTIVTMYFGQVVTTWRGSSLNIQVEVSGHKLGNKTLHRIRLAMLTPVFVHSSSVDCGDWESLWWLLSASSPGTLYWSSHAQGVLCVSPLRLLLFALIFSALFLIRLISALKVLEILLLFLLSERTFQRWNILLWALVYQELHDRAMRLMGTEELAMLFVLWVHLWWLNNLETKTHQGTRGCQQPHLSMYKLLYFKKSLFCNTWRHYLWTRTCRACKDAPFSQTGAGSPNIRQGENSHGREGGRTIS